MKYVIQGAVIIALIGVALWVLWPTEDPAPGPTAEPAPAAKAPLPGHDIAPPDPGKPVDTLDPALRARLLAALALRVAQAQEVKAAAPDATASEPPPPRSPEWVRELRGYVKSTTRAVQPVVLGCVSAALEQKPELASSGGAVKIHVAGAPGLGSVVSRVELEGAQGALDAPGLQSCIEEKAFFMRLGAAPPEGTDEGGPTVITFPLAIPGR